MITFAPSQSAECWAWFMRHTTPSLSRQAKAIVAWRGEERAAMVVFDQWTENSAQLHIAIPDPIVLKHGFLEELFGYLFGTTGRAVALGVTHSSNKTALKFNAHVGMVEVYRIKDGATLGDDLVLQELRKEDCKWITHEEAA